jgi:hypothetical protein
MSLLNFIVSFNLQEHRKLMGEFEYATTQVNVFVNDEFVFFIFVMHLICSFIQVCLSTVANFVRVSYCKLFSCNKGIFK